MKKYILLYSDKKPEDNICLTNMFKNNKKINLGWTDFDYNNNMKVINEEIEKGVKQIIFAGLEIGWGKMIADVKEKYPDIEIKVICTTQDSLLYYEYERNNFFELLELSKKEIVTDIAFLRKGQYETYKKLGYNCSYLMENYILSEKEKQTNIQSNNEKVNLGIYPLNYTWNKNIFNQLCVAKFLDNCELNYYNLDPRMEEFLTTMGIQNTPEKLEEIKDKDIIKSILKNDVIVSTAFTEYMHPIFWLGMENRVPVLIGNNSDLFNGEELEKYIVTSAEDNAIINSKMIKKILDDKEKIMDLYKTWKESYNNKARKNLAEFLES